VNPVLLVEVTSDSTEDYDRGEKLRHYQQLPSVREVLFVSHREPRVTLHRREHTGWVVVDSRAGHSVDLASVQVNLAVNDLYRDGLEDLAWPPRPHSSLSHPA
jgi:Uma2 family endonuclease